jgi:hypothetical protein
MVGIKWRWEGESKPEVKTNNWQWGFELKLAKLEKDAWMFSLEIWVLKAELVQACQLKTNFGQGYVQLATAGRQLFAFSASTTAY